MINLEELAANVTISFFANGILVFLMKNWIVARLENSIKHEYAIKLEEFKGELRARNLNELEKTKSDLLIESSSAIEDYKQKLQNLHSKNTLRYESVYNKSLSHAEELSSSLYKLNMSVGRYISKPTKGRDEEKLDIFRESVDEFHAVYARTKLYLPRETQKLFEEFITKVYNLISSYIDGVEENDEITTEFVNIQKSFSSEIIPNFETLNQALSDLFSINEVILGVNDDIN